MASNSPTDFDTKVSNQITPISVSGPQATMYGLRFEGQRKTKLYFPNPGTGSRKATVSMWFKHTKSTDFYALFSQGQDSNNDGFFTRFRIENGKLRVETAQAAGVQQVSMVTSSVIPDKLWQHLVVSFDSDSEMIMYLNGQEVGRRALESTGKYPWEAGRDTNIGCLGKNASGDDIQFYEGYLSDVFYVEGQDLPPETFGEDFEGKWGPLDSSKVIENIGSVDETEFPSDQYNTDETWSQTVVGVNYNPPPLMFDGDLTTRGGVEVRNTSSTGTITHTTDPIACTSLRFHARLGQNCNGKITSGGQEIQLDADNSTKWYPFPTPPATFDGFVADIYDLTASPLGLYIFAVEVNGRILVDKPSFGTNGFYLPFNPDAFKPGTIVADYSTYTTTTAAAGFSDPPELSYDGDPNTTLRMESAQLSDQWETDFTLGGTQAGLIAAHSVKLNIDNGNPHTFELHHAGGVTSWVINNRVTIECFNTSDQLYELGTGDALVMPITKIVAIKSVTSGAPKLNGIIIDGAYLIDSSISSDIKDYTIGVDASGNDNHFTDENFQLQPATLYSRDITYKGDYFAGSKEEIFNGDPTFTKLVVSQTDGSAFIKWTGTLENVTSLSVFTERNGYVEVVGNLGTIQQSYTLGGSSVEVVITPGNLAAVGTTITSISTHWVAYPDQVYMYSIKVNGSLLVDAEDVGVDAVKDTPMLSYAVLETGANGNLEATGSSSITYLGEAGTDYYYEEDGVGKVHAGGGAFTSTSGKTYNFGQQPYVFPYDNSKIWSPALTAPGGFLSTAPAARAFSGERLSAVADSSSDDITFTTSDFPAESGPYSVVVYADYRHAVTIDGTVTDVDSGTDVQPHRATVNQVSSIVISPGSGRADVSGIIINGKELLDSDSDLSIAKSNELFQTWAEWNDYVTLRADNPEHVAKFNTIKDALEHYEGDVRQFRADVVSRLAADGFSIQEMDALDLVNSNTATAWAQSKGYEDGNLVTHNGEYWFALSSSYNNSPDDNDPEDWVSLGVVPQ